MACCIMFIDISVFVNLFIYVSISFKLKTLLALLYLHNLYLNTPCCVITFRMHRTEFNRFLAMLCKRLFCSSCKGESQ